MSDAVGRVVVSAKVGAKAEAAKASYASVPNDVSAVRERLARFFYLRGKVPAADLDVVSVLLDAHTDMEELVAEAESLRARSSLTVRSILSALFLLPEWIDADLAARRSDASVPLVLTDASLTAATAESLAAEVVADLTEAELRVLFVGVEAERFALANLSRPTLLLAVASRLANAPDKLWFWDRLRPTFDVLSVFEESGAVARIAADCLSSIEKFGVSFKAKDNPRSLAVQCLLRSPGPALAHVCDRLLESWAKPVLIKLEGSKAAAPSTSPPLEKTKRGQRDTLWNPDALPPLRDSAGGRLGEVGYEELREALTSHDAASLERAKSGLERGSAAAFAWELAQAWLSAGAPAKSKWAFLALGYLGDAGAAGKLAELIPAWADEKLQSQSKLGLQVLAEMNSDSSVTALGRIASSKSRSWLKAEAAERLGALAKRRGVTVDDLTEQSAARVDPSSPEARASIKMLQKRLESAMTSERRWSLGAFRSCFTSLQIGIRAVHGLVFGDFDERGVLETQFIVDRSGALLGEDGSSVTLGDGASIGVVHRLLLSSAEVSAWQSALARADARQPFEQLERAVFELKREDLDTTTLAPSPGIDVRTDGILALLDDRGWKRGEIEDSDHGLWNTMHKPIGSGLFAFLELSSSILATREYFDEEQRILELCFTEVPKTSAGGRTERVILRHVPRIALSEVLRDVASAHVR